MKPKLCKSCDIQLKQIEKLCYERGYRDAMKVKYNLDNIADILPTRAEFKRAVEFAKKNDEKIYPIKKVGKK